MKIQWPWRLYTPNRNSRMLHIWINRFLDFHFRSAYHSSYWVFIKKTGWILTLRLSTKRAKQKEMFKIANNDVNHGDLWLVHLMTSRIPTHFSCSPPFLASDNSHVCNRSMGVVSLKQQTIPQALINNTSELKKINEKRTFNWKKKPVLLCITTQTLNWSINYCYS